MRYKLRRLSRRSIAIFGAALVDLLVVVALVTRWFGIQACWDRMDTELISCLEPPSVLVISLLTLVGLALFAAGVLSVIRDLEDRSAR